ncbi:type IV pilus modification protein PilV [Methyloglobulus sp.]|jgi:type IV pilus assembly protein PilV|uniref:type IV pilus modification protein PilV n=1 Tax=Methyloglobulus sp. TaxID=2518622 RepID=UPI0032B721B1
MKQQSGFTLIEVLIAVVILAVGLLGLASLQAVGLGNNQSAYNRSQATQLAYDIADRMRANASTAAQARYLPDVMLPADALCRSGTTPCSDCTTSANSCSTDQLAQKDLLDWNNDLVATLPSGTGTITRAAGVFSVIVSWDDGKTGAANRNFRMDFRL